MRHSSRSAILLGLLLALPLVTRDASASAIRLVATDARGVTLRLDAPPVTLGPADAEGRSDIETAGLERIAETGRPRLPLGTATIAIPPGARVTAHVIGEEAAPLQDNVRLRIGMKAGFRGDDGRLGMVPYLEPAPPILDGPFPSQPVEVSEPFTIRHQWVVMVRVFPHRYDPETERLWSRRSITVRLDFSGGASVSSLAEPRDEGHWEPVLSGTLLNYEQGRGFREPALRSADARAPGVRPAGLEFDEDEPEVRVGPLDTTGVYAIDFDELAAHQYPSGVPVAEVSAHRHEYLQDPVPPAPPYVTIELPIEVDDQDGNGIFGSGDRILLFVQSWAERSRATIGQRTWGEGEVVFVTRLRSRPGLRMPSRPGWRDLSLTPLVSYPWTQRWEKNDFYVNVFLPEYTDTGSTDPFLWSPRGVSVQLSSDPDSFRFETNDLDTSRTVRFQVAWRGTRLHNASHRTSAHVRNAQNRFTTIVDPTAAWEGRSLRIGSATLFGSALSEGNRNVLRSWGRTEPCPDPVDCDRVFALVDWFQATYWRRFNALNGYLSCSSGNVAGDYEIRATGFGFADQIRVYDVTDSLNPVKLSLADSLRLGTSYPFGIKFQDTAPAGVTRRYVAFDSPRRLAPDRYGTVTRRRLTERADGDYLLIVPEAFLPAVEPLRQLRESMGLRVAVAPLESLNDEFNGGRKSAYAIKRYIRYAYRNWNAAFVLLVGDASEDPRHFIPTSPPDWVPAPEIDGPVSIPDGFYSNVFESIPSDPWYVWCVECPNPGPSTPRLHDLFIGRFPVNSLQQTQNVVDKVVAYENIQPGESWRREMLLVADDAYSTQSTFGGDPGGATYCYKGWEETFIDITERFRDIVLDEGGLTQANPYVFDLGDSLASEQVDGNNCRLSWPGTQQSTRIAVTPELLKRLNAGVLLWNFQGHANPSVITHEDIYVNDGPEDDKDRLQNAGKPFVFAGFSCHPNHFNRIEEGNPAIGPSLGEEMVMLPDRRGAVASWASSGYEIIPFNAETHLNLRLGRALFARASWDSASRSYWDGRVILGQSIAKALIDNLPRAAFQERNVGVSYNLLGDPATRISIGAPMITVKANGQDVISGEPVRLLTQADTLRVEADIASNTRIQSITLERSAGAGLEIVPPSEYTLTPAFPDTIGGRRYHLSYFTQLSQGGANYVLRVVNVNGVPASFEILFRFFHAVLADGIPVVDGDPVKPDVRFQIKIISPQIIADPYQALVLLVDSVQTTFTAERPPDDLSGRAWVITWTHPPYPAGDLVIELVVNDQFPFRTRLRVTSETALRNSYAFPNPFDDDLGTHFSFMLEGAAANVLLRVYTVSGRMIYERAERGLSPGYHQLAWNGEDAEGDKLANGVYFYRLVAQSGSGSMVHEGRLVKLRKPRRRSIEEP